MGTFSRNIINSFIIQALIFIINLLFSIVIVRSLGPNLKGVYTMATLFYFFLVNLTSLSIAESSIYFAAKKKYEEKVIFGNNIIFAGIMSSLATLVGAIVIFFWGELFFPGVDTIYLLASLLLVPGHLFFSYTSHILIGLQKIIKYNYLQLTRAFVLLVVISICLLGLGLKVMAAIFAGAIAFFIATVVAVVILIKELNGISFKFNINYIRDAFVYGTKAHIGNILLFTHYRIDLILINILLNTTMVGFYSVSSGLSEKLSVIASIVGMVLFPKIASEKDATRREFTPFVFRSFLFITILIAVLSMTLGHWLIIALYSSAFLESVRPFQILLLGAIFMSGIQILQNDLKGRGKPLLYTYSIGISVLLNVILNLIFIPKFGIIGASWATAISYGTALFVLVIAYSKISGNSISSLILLKISDITYYKYLRSPIRKDTA